MAFEPVMIKRKPLKPYPGKPGPAYQGGLRRPFVLPVLVSLEENEYIVRKCFDLNISKSEYFRQCSLPVGWENELVGLRQNQVKLTEEQIIRTVGRPRGNGKK
jgi:hypothetical protein